MPYCIFQDICTDIKLHGLHEEGKKFRVLLDRIRMKQNVLFILVVLGDDAFIVKKYYILLVN